MWFRSFLDALRAGFLRRSRRSRHRRPPGQPPPSRPHLETLEDRFVPSFAAAANYTVGSLPQAVALGHFDSGDTLDLVVANYSTSNVSVLLGKGDGTFQDAKNSPTGSGPLAVAVGDFNNDGNLDVVTANYSDLSILLGNGDGTFQDPTSLSLGSNPLSVAVGDFNNDGNLDLGVTSNLYQITGSYIGYYGGIYYYGAYFGYANVLLGNGQGDFSSASTTSLNSGFPVGAAVGDLDGDTNLDLVVANSDFNTVSVLRGDGNGGFSSLADYSADYYPRSVAVGDVDGDHDLDLVTANYYFYGGNVSVLLNDGTGGFGTAKNFSAGLNPFSVALGDFNADNIPDLVTANYSGGNISVLLGKGGGDFNIAQNSGVGSGPVSVVAGNFNGDDFPDVAVANASSGNVSVLLNAKDFPPGDAPSVSIGDMTITEGNTGTKEISFTVTLSAAYSKPITVSFTTADGTATTADNDYVAKSGTVTFNPGDPLTQSITITVNGDRRGEPNETFFVKLTGATNAFLDDTQGVGTIVDDEPRITIKDASITEGNRGTKVLTFTVTLSSPYDVPVTVNYTTSNGSATTANNDYVAKSGMVTFAANQTTQTITITINGDKRRESNEFFYVTLSDATNALIEDDLGVGTILNDDKRGGGNQNR
jgi:hypothetical protein